MTKSGESYSLIDHTADIGVEVQGEDFPALLKHAAEALFCVITDTSTVQPKSRFKIVIPSQKKEEMMRNWLEKLLYYFNIEDMLFSRFSVSASDHNHLIAKSWGEVFDPKRHLIYTEIKGITYHQFEVSQSEAGWYARIIFDV